jgi:hypothetical protein
MELLSRDRTICGGLFAAQRVRNRRLSKPNTVVIRRAGYGALGRLDRVRGVRFLRLTRHAAGGPAQPEMTLRRPPRSFLRSRGRSGGHVVSPIASRRPDKNSSRCCGFLYGSGRFTITSGMIARSRAIDTRENCHSAVRHRCGKPIHCFLRTKAAEKDHKSVWCHGKDSVKVMAFSIVHPHVYGASGTRRL